MYDIEGSYESSRGSGTALAAVEWAGVWPLWIVGWMPTPDRNRCNRIMTDHATAKVNKFFSKCVIY